MDGIALTQTGALNRALVREVVELRPEWWDTALFGPPNREDDVVPARAVSTTCCARCGCCAAPAVALSPPPEPVRCSSSRLSCWTPARLRCLPAIRSTQPSASSLPPSCSPASRIDDNAVHPAILEEGWHAGGVPPSVYAVGGAIGRLLWGLEALDLVKGSRRSGVDLTPSGHRALLVGLRARAIAPRTRL